MPALASAAALLVAIVYALGLLGSAVGAAALFCVLACTVTAFRVCAAGLSIGFLAFTAFAARFDIPLPPAHHEFFLAILCVPALGFVVARRPLWSAGAALPRWLHRILGSHTRPLLAFLGIISLLAMNFTAFPIRDCLLCLVATLVVHAKTPRIAPRALNFRKLLRTSAASSLSIGIAIAIIEVGAATFIFPEGRTGQFYIGDPENLFRLRPGAKGQRYFRTGPDTTAPVWWEISSQGLRDLHVPPKPPGEFRVVLIGDSFTFGATVNFEDTIGQHLEGILREQHPDRPIRVINLGVGGMGPWQERRTLNNVGFGFEPDLVIHQLFLANDIANELTSVNQRLDSIHEKWESTVERWRLNNLRRFRIESALWTHSDAYAAVTQWIGRDRIVALLAAGTRTLPKVNLHSRPRSTNRPPELEVDLTEWYPAIETGWNLLIGTVAATAADCAERGVHYAVYNVPSIEEMVDYNWNLALTAVQDGSTYDRGKSDRMLAKELTARGLNYIPLKSRLSTSPDLEALYFLHDGHLTPLGNRLVAETLAEYIQQSRLLVADATAL